jgi:hypothetical protein
MVKEEKANNSTQTVIIFDWDDTLLASSFLTAKGFRLDNNPERSTELETQLRELESSVVAVLTLAISYGPVHIVTNAEHGWVQLSAQKFIPAVVPLLSNNNIKVVSARSTYEALFPDSPVKWKYYAFQDKLATYFTDMKVDKNVISFGDSHVEREAVRAVTKGFPSTRTKSVKFAERPSMEQLRRQIELVTNCFHYIYHHDGDLDLQLTVTVNSPPSPSTPPQPQSQPQQQPQPAPLPASSSSSSNQSSHANARAASSQQAPLTPTPLSSSSSSSNNSSSTNAFNSAAAAAVASAASAAVSSNMMCDDSTSTRPMAVEAIC